MKRLLFLLVIGFITTNCDRIPLMQEEKIYYKFSQDDYNFIPQKYEAENGINRFISNSGESIFLNNGGYNKTEVIVYPNYSLTQTIYYDNIHINLNWHSLSECNHITIEISKDSDNSLIYNLVFWNNGIGCNGIHMSFNTSQNFTHLQIGNKIYKYVIELELNNFFIDVSINKKINKVYYDLENGLIGFENTTTNDFFWLQ